MMFTHDEKTLLLLYHEETVTATRKNLKDVRSHLQSDEKELRNMIDSVLAKLQDMTDTEFQRLDFFEEMG